MVEQIPLKDKVEGPNPSGRTKFDLLFKLLYKITSFYFGLLQAKRNRQDGQYELW